MILDENDDITIEDTDFCDEEEQADLELVPVPEECITLSRHFRKIGSTVPGDKTLYEVRPSKSRAQPFKPEIPILDEENPNILFPDEIEIDDVPQMEDPHCDDGTDTEDVVINPAVNEETAETDNEGDDESNDEGDDEGDDKGDDEGDDAGGGASERENEPLVPPVKKPPLTLKSVLEKFRLKESKRIPELRAAPAKSSEVPLDVLANTAGDARKRHRSGSNSDREAPPDFSRDVDPLPSSSTPLPVTSTPGDDDDYPSPSFSPIPRGRISPKDMRALKRRKTDSPRDSPAPTAGQIVDTQQTDNVAETGDTQSNVSSPKVLRQKSARQYSADRKTLTSEKPSTSIPSSSTGAAARPTRRKLFVSRDREDSELVAASAFNVRARMGQMYEDANCIRSADQGVDPFGFSISSPPRVGVTSGYTRCIQQVPLTPFQDVPDGSLIKVKFNDTCYWPAILVGPPNAPRGIYAKYYRIRYIVAASDGTATVGKDTVPMAKQFMKNWIPSEIEKDCSDKWPINLQQVPLNLKDSEGKENCYPTILAMKRSHLIDDAYEPMSYDKFLQWIRGCPTCPASLKPSKNAKGGKDAFKFFYIVLLMQSLNAREREQIQAESRYYTYKSLTARTRAGWQSDRCFTQKRSVEKLNKRENLLAYNSLEMKFGRFHGTLPQPAKVRCGRRVEVPLSANSAQTLTKGVRRAHGFPQSSQFRFCPHEVRAIIAE
ncbi:unnamed protein product [Trichogramma brassicae]|uniref:PWWP domain-containing protein n=1 Tax=Trichogramma brassicae TaxID=86971 RepID=A0A6H5I2P4_9HYME|nr:unnamed protein product [Trichogramma brassicae]